MALGVVSGLILEGQDPAGVTPGALPVPLGHVGDLRQARLALTEEDGGTHRSVRRENTRARQELSALFEAQKAEPQTQAGGPSPSGARCLSGRRAGRAGRGCWPPLHRRGDRAGGRPPVT